MYYYLPYKERLYSEYIGFYTTYGIKAHKLLNRKTTQIPDVSVNKWLVLKICLMCTSRQLEPIHLHDVVVDNI